MAYGNYSSLDPYSKEGYGEIFTGYGLTAGNIGGATSIQTANQIAEVDARLREGMKVIEIQPIQQEVFEQIPKEHFKEINRMAKLANAKISMHAPITDPSGFTDKGWSEKSRVEAERHLLSAVKRAHDAAPEGNMPIVIHASAIPAAEWNADLKPTDEEKRLGIKPKEMLAIVNRQTGEITGAKREKMYVPGKKEPEIMYPEQRLRSSNASDWDAQLKGASDLKKELDDSMDKITVVISGAEKEKRDLTRQEEIFIGRMQNRIANYDPELRKRLNSMYSNAVEFGDKETKKTLSKVHDLWVEGAKKISQYDPRSREGHMIRKQLYDGLFHGLQETRDSPPEVYQPVEKFAIGHASETLGNVAFKAYKDFKENAPVISVENVLPNMAFSRAEQLQNLIEESRKKFADQAIKEEGLKRKEAEKLAEKHIGATWDVGHINMLRKSGFKEKEVIKETEKIAPFVKHVHLTDNFGFTDSHLALGMGHVPMKKMMEKIKEEGYDGRAIVEAGAYAANFKSSPHGYSLESLKAPIYYPAVSGPTWGESRRSEFAGGAPTYGPFLPEQHFAMYGGGFSTLPPELGGRAAGKGRRFSGTPME